MGLLDSREYLVYIMVWDMIQEWKKYVTLAQEDLYDLVDGLLIRDYSQRMQSCQSISLFVLWLKPCCRCQELAAWKKPAEAPKQSEGIIRDADIIHKPLLCSVIIIIFCLPKRHFLDA
jgi:hypothetical protein